MLGAIDVGSHTARLLIAECKGGRLYPVKTARKITRLNMALCDGRLTGHEINATIKAVKEFGVDLRKYNVDRYVAVATNVFREAVNGAEIINRIRKDTGVNVEIITGEKEAFLTSSGILITLDHPPVNAILFDLGGGSTELSLINNGMMLEKISLGFGAASLTRNFIKNDPSLPEELEGIHKYIKKNLNKICNKWAAMSGDDACLVGTAGTVTTLAAVMEGLTEYDPERINNSKIQKDDVLKLLIRLNSTTVSERACINGLEAGRADVIIAGTVAVLAIMECFGFSQLVVSDGGLLEGLILSQC